MNRRSLFSTSFLISFVFSCASVDDVASSTAPYNILSVSNLTLSGNVVIDELEGQKFSCKYVPQTHCGDSGEFWQIAINLDGIPGSPQLVVHGHTSNGGSSYTYNDPGTNEDVCQVPIGTYTIYYREDKGGLLSLTNLDVMVSDVAEATDQRIIDVSVSAGQVRLVKAGSQDILYMFCSSETTTCLQYFRPQLTCALSK